MTLSELEDDTQVEKLNSEAFEEMSVDQFLETPGAAVAEKVMPTARLSPTRGLRRCTARGSETTFLTTASTSGRSRR